MAAVSRGEDDDEEPRPDRAGAEHRAAPVKRLEIGEAMGALEKALGALPRRQQQAFMLRTLEGMDVAQTAAAMGCSEGSVKTHYFRACRRCARNLGNLYV